MQLLNDQTANGSGEYQPWSGGEATVFAWGNFDGATLKLDVRPRDESEVFNHTRLTFTEKTMVNFSLPACDIRGTVESAGASTSVSINVDHIREVR